MRTITRGARLVSGVRCQMWMKLLQGETNRPIEIECCFQNFVRKKEPKAALIDVLCQFLVTGDRLSKTRFRDNKDDVVARLLQDTVQGTTNPGFTLVICGLKISCAVTGQLGQELARKVLGLDTKECVAQPLPLG